MSPPGDESASKRSTSEEARGHNASLAFPRSGPNRDSQSEASGALPLRLSVAQQGLGIELNRAVDLGLVVVEQIDVALLNVKFPVDLSKGVKQFLSRRGALRHLEASVDLLKFGRRWGERLSEAWGVSTTVRLRLVFEGAALEKGAPHRAENDAGQPTAIAVSIHTDDACLAFDLVLCSGHQPRFAVDSPRSFGKLPKGVTGPPLFLSFQAIDLALGLLDPSSQPLSRRGRTLELNDLARVLVLAVLPRFGCRLPQVEGQVVREVVPGPGKLTIVLGASDEHFTAGRRALEVSGRAALAMETDALLSTGELSSYRAGLLEMLQVGPAQHSFLLELAELDLSEPDRAEAVLAELDEIGIPRSEALKSGGESSATVVRHCLALARAFDATGKRETAAELLAQAALLEPNGVLASFIGLEISRRETQPEKRRRALNEAVARAPFLMNVRLERLRLELQAGEEESAQKDAQRLDASLNEVEQRVRLGLELGCLFLGSGSVHRAEFWLRRCVRLNPEDPAVLLALAECLSRSGQASRAAELTLSALRILEAAVTLVHQRSGDGTSVEVLESLYGQISCSHFRVAKYLRAAGVESGQVLAHLALIESRSPEAVESRILAAEIHDEEQRFEERDQVLVRLLDSIELGHVPEAPRPDLFMALLDGFRGTVSDDLREFAERVLLQPGRS